MNQHVNAATKAVTKDQLIEEFNSVVSETEHLLRSVANAGGEKAGAWRDGVEQKLALAKDRLFALRQAATDTTKAAAKSTDEYVHAHPWHAIGVAAGLTAVVALAMILLQSRR